MSPSRGRVGLGEGMFQAQSPKNNQSQGSPASTVTLA